MEIAALGLRVDADGVDRAAKSLENLSAQGDKAEKAVGGIEKTAAKVQKSLEGLGKSGVDAGQSVKKVGDDSSAAKAPVDALGASADKAAQAEARLAEQAERAGMSVGAMKAALRGVPAQFTDIAVSLQGGMSPLTVFLQQGGQLKDMFNGAGNAAQALGSYVIGLVNPFTVAAAAAAALGVAYYQGSKELDALRLAIVTTGNATGVSVTQLRQLAQEMGAVSGSEAKASAALASFARAGVQGIDTLKDYAQAAVDWEKTTGTSVEKTAKAFASLQEDPLKAAMDLQKGMKFLTVATYEQAKAFEDQGKKSEAAAVLQRQYAKTLNDGSSEIKENLGTLERAWEKLGKTSSKVWDLMLGVGRASTLADKIAGVREDIAGMERQLAQGSGFGNTGGGAATGRGTSRLTQQDIQALQDRIRLRYEELGVMEKEANLDKEKAESKAKETQAAEALAEWNQRELKYLSDAEKLKRELNQERELGVRAGKSEKEILDRLAAIREEYAQKNKGAAREMNKEISEQAKVYAELAGLTSTYYTELARGQKQFEKGEITREQYVKFVETLIQKQPFVIAQKKEEAKVLQESLALAERERQQRLKVYASAEKNTSSIQDGNKKLREEIELIGLSSDAQESILMQRERAILLVKQQHLAELERAEAVFGFMSREQIALMQEIDALEERLALMGDKGIREKSARVGKQIEQDWEKVSQTISRTLSDYIMSGGTDAAVYLKRLFANLVLEPLVQIGVNSLLGMGAPAAGMASGGVNPLSVLSGGKTAMGIFGGGAGAGFMNGLGAWGSGGSVTGVLSNPGLYTGAELLGTVAPILLGGIAVVGLIKKLFGGSRGLNHTGAAYSTTGVDSEKAAGLLFGGTTEARYGDMTTRYNKDVEKGLKVTVDALAAMYKTLGKIGGANSRDIDIVAGFATNPKYESEGVYGYFNIIDKLTGEVLKKYVNRETLGQDPQKGWERFVADMGGALIDEIKKGDIPGWMREELDTLGDNVTVEGLNTVIQKIAVIDAAFKGWADTVIGFANLTAKAQTELLKFSNGIETLAGNVNAFYAGFYSEQERAAILQRQVMEQLKGLGVEIDPAAGKAAKDQFRKLIEEALASGNNELAAKLLALAQVFGVVADAAGKVLEGLAGERAQLEAELLRATGRTDEYNAALRRLATEGMSEAEKAAWDYNAALRAEIAARDQQQDLERQWLELTGDTAELRRRELAALDPSNRALQERIWALEDERTAAEATAQAAQKVKDAAWANFEAAVGREKEYWQGVVANSQSAMQAIASILTPLKQGAKELFGSIDAAQQMQAAQGMVYIEQALAGVRGGAKLSSFDGLSDAIAAARGGITSGRYASQFERDRDALVLANQLSQIAGYGDVQLSVEEKQLKNSQEQLQRLDKTLSYWRDLLNGNAAQIDATMSVERAIELLRAVLVPGSKPGPGAGGGTGSGAGGPDFGGTIPGDGSGGAPAASKYNQVRIYGGDVWYEPIIDKQLIDKLDRLSPIYHSFDGTGDVRGLLEAIKAAGGTLGDLSAMSGFFESDWRKAASSVGIPAFAVGTNYVPRDMLAQIHEGEAIVPKAFNPWAGGTGAGVGNNNERLEALVAQLIDENRTQAGQIVRLHGVVAKLLQRWDGDGMPQPRKEGEGVAA